MGISLEFGRPLSSPQALIRLPGREHADYPIDGGPVEHVAHFKEWVLEMFSKYMNNGFENIPIGDRSIPLNAADLRYIFGQNSYWQNREDVYTQNWAYVEEDETNPWCEIVPLGDDEHRWWQISSFTPDTEFGDHKLYCVEMNSRFKQKDTKIRLDEFSDIEIVFATEKEIEALKASLIY